MKHTSITLPNNIVIDQQTYITTYFDLSPVGTLYIPLEVTGIDTPETQTTDISSKWIRLVAGLTGSGQFNENKLTSESLSGSFPLNIATAVVDDVDSPLYGETVNLLETERRFLRAGNVGGLEDHQM